MVINIVISVNLIFLLNALINVNGKPAFIETMGAECDYEDMGSNTRNVPIILSQKSQATAFAGKPIYVAPDFTDILDQQTFNVYHEEVHGTILMPRVKFSLNHDDDCIQEKDDYLDYGNSLNSFASRYLQARPRNFRKPSMYNPYRYARYPMSRVDPNAPVKVDLNGGYNPTIEEMVPYMKRRHTPNTYIVMVDDPVVVVDAVPSCSNETGNSTTTVSADTTTTTTTAAPARKKRQADKDAVLQAVGGVSGRKKRQADTDAVLKTVGGLTSRKKRQADTDALLQTVGGVTGGGGGGGNGGKKGKGGGGDGGLLGRRKKRSPNKRGAYLMPRKKRSPSGSDTLYEIDVPLFLANGTHSNSTYDATNAPLLSNAGNGASRTTTTGKPNAGVLPVKLG